MKVLIFGAAGMLGSELLRCFYTGQQHSVRGVVRNEGDKALFPLEYASVISCIPDFFSEHSLDSLFLEFQPDWVINCVGVVKQLQGISSEFDMIRVNSLFPYVLSGCCETYSARLLQVGTDCVFSGNRGGYKESDLPDALDIYGRSKLLGEISQHQHVLTLRTSIIGHELKTSHSLIDWFLSQSGQVSGYRKAVFSGLPTTELARVLSDYIFNNKALYGLYHLSVEPINKCDLLNLVAKKYCQRTIINPVDSIVIDRSLNSQRFRDVAGYKPPSWPEMIEAMCLSYGWRNENVVR